MVLVVSADIFPKWDKKLIVNSSFLWYNDEVSSDIVIDDVTIDLDQDSNVWVLKYVVKNWDVLWKIASSFGTTVTNIKKVNKIDWPIKAGQVLVITNDDDWFLYSIPENINVIVFVNKYNLNLEDFMTLNYVQDQSEMLYAWQDVFVNITDEKAYDNGLKQRPKPVIVKANNLYKPIINKPITKKTFNQTNNNDGNIIVPAKKSKIISQRVFKKDIKNSFYPGYCTWYAAIISPEIFPYSAENKQERLFGGNASAWCANAKAAWFRVWNKPSVWALIVYKRSLWRIASAWHVAKVINHYPDDDKLVVKEMNRAGKFIVTERREETNNSNISCYIYGK